VTEFTPIMPFWIDTDAYTDRDRLMFVCGTEFEMIYTALKADRGWDQCIHTENESRVKMMCAKLGKFCKMDRYDDTWTFCTIIGGDLL
jgi:hypothetical protein